MTRRTEFLAGHRDLVAIGKLRRSGSRSSGLVAAEQPPHLLLVSADDPLDPLTRIVRRPLGGNGLRHAQAVRHGTWIGCDEIMAVLAQRA